MTPIDFVVFSGDSEPNMPVHKVAEAMQQPVLFFVGEQQHVVCGYYYLGGQMIAELKPIGETK